ncbi:hypothetical protein [Actinophytocola glycyrrhizae]|uniref:Trypsin-like peptidase n=1 Tax=Actinophytocola glycyrrhizae TaxID=2044873 RepID=A0ABV9SAC0_9PSEU
MVASSLDDAVLVVTDGEGHVLGSCFRAPILDSDRTGTYLVTTAHGLAVDARRGNTVLVVDRAGRCHQADVVLCPTSAPDVGLLYVGRHLGEPLDCVSPAPSGAVVIRGAMSGLDTRIGSLRGWHTGLESLTGEQMMAVTIHDLGFLEPSASADHVGSLAYAGLRGMSGAPVCDADTREAHAYGMVVRRNIGGIANRVYAVPIDTVRRYLARAGYALRVTRRLDNSSQPESLLVGRLMTRLLGSPGGLHDLWEVASGLFYSGVPVDATFLAAIRQPEQFGLDTLRVAELEFLLARLLFKRGDQRDGLALLRKARALAGRSATADHRGLAALIDLRMALHVARELSPARRRSVLELCVGTYEQAPGYSDDEQAYEVASAIGSEASQLAADTGFVRADAAARRHFSTLLTKHTGLLTGYPRLLRDKQEVVNLALSAVDIMWGTDDRAERAERLTELAARGKLAAIQRGNKIFYTQMLLADAIAAQLNGRPRRAYALTCLVGAIMASSDLRLSHEGVPSYLSYLDENDRTTANLLRTAYAVDLPDARSVLLASELPPSADRSALDAALAWCQSIEINARNISDIFELETLIRDL